MFNYKHLSSICNKLKECGQCTGVLEKLEAQLAWLTVQTIFGESVILL